jgi:outer membrane lipoprotein SlyB
MKNNRSLKVLVALVCLTLVSACAKDISSYNYSDSQAGEASSVVRGTIISSRVVMVTSNNQVGTIAGGAAGAVAGSSLGGGRGQLLTTIGGAVLGGIAGNAAQNQLGKQQAIEYIIKTTPNHKLVSVTQGLQDQLHVGEKVMIIYGSTTRVIRDTGIE